MSHPDFSIRVLRSCSQWFGRSRLAGPALFLAFMIFWPAVDSFGQNYYPQAQSRSNVHARNNHPLDPVPKLKQIQHKIARTLFGTPQPPRRNGYLQPTRTHGQRPTVYEHSNYQRMPANGQYRTPHRVERNPAVRDRLSPEGFPNQHRLVNYQEDQVLPEPESRNSMFQGDQRWLEADQPDPRNNRLPMQSQQFENPTAPQFSPLPSKRGYHPQDAQRPAIGQNQVDAYPANAGDWNSGYPTNSLRTPGRDPSQGAGSIQYGSASSSSQQPDYGGHMRAGTPFQGRRFPEPSLTATERALQLESEVAELEKRVAYLEKVNEQLRQRVNQYENVTSQTTTKMSQVAQQLIQADDSNQKLLQRIAFLESENQKIRKEASRVLDSIKHNLDDLLLRELKHSNSAGQLRGNQ